MTEPGSEAPGEVRAAGERFRVREPARSAVLQRLDVGGPLAAETPERLEARLTRLGVPAPEARAVAGGADLQATAARLPGETRLALERVLGANDLVGVAYLDLARAAARAVGRVVLRAPGGQVVGYGTGWLCGPGVMLTNHHVLPGIEDARAAVLEFDYEVSPDGTLRPPTPRSLDPEALYLTSDVLDYTLVAVSGDLSPFGWLPLYGSADKNVLGEALSIVQHPGGEPKQIALRDNRLVDRLPDFLHYETDTAPGSSGSPVLNDALEVVALHHSGVPRTDAQGRVLRRDGRVAGPGDPEDAIDWIANEGVRISRIVDDLRQKPEAASPLLAGVLAARRAPLSPPPGREATSGPLLDLGTVQPDALGAVRVPATVQLRLAAPTAAPETRPYLDPGDANAAAAYYAGVADTLSPQERFRALSELLARTHARRPGYAPSRELYPWVDLWPDGQLRSLYSAKPAAPERYIAADEAARAARERVAAQEGLDVAALEAALPYNCEHVVPQSWFGAAEPMRGDLHHLFACESGCNSFRGNAPYADLPPLGEATRGDCGERAPAGFEPAHGRGAAARATLYFLLRYPGLARLYDAGDLGALLAWHGAQPPGDWERHRNAAIYARQGNRNPLIDRPEWGTITDFTPGLGRQG